MDGYFMTLVENKGMPLGIKLHTPMFGTCETGNIVHGKIYQDDREIQLIKNPLLRCCINLSPPFRAVVGFCTPGPSLATYVDIFMDPRLHLMDVLTMKKQLEEIILRIEAGEIRVHLKSANVSVERGMYTSLMNRHVDWIHGQDKNIFSEHATMHEIRIPYTDNFILCKHPFGYVYNIRNIFSSVELKYHCPKITRWMHPKNGVVLDNFNADSMHAMYRVSDKELPVLILSSPRRIGYWMELFPELTYVCKSTRIHVKPTMKVCTTPKSFNHLYNTFFADIRWERVVVDNPQMITKDYGYLTKTTFHSNLKVLPCESLWVRVSGDHAKKEITVEQLAQMVLRHEEVHPDDCRTMWNTQTVHNTVFSPNAQMVHVVTVSTESPSPIQTCTLLRKPSISDQHIEYIPIEDFPNDQWCEADESTCSVCWTSKRNVVFGCGHSFCSTCTFTMCDNTRSSLACPMCRTTLETVYISDDWNLFWETTFGSDFKTLMQWCKDATGNCLLISNVRAVRTAVAMVCREAKLMEFKSTMEILKPTDGKRIIVSGTSDLIGCHLHDIQNIAWADSDPVSHRAQELSIVQVLGVTFSHTQPLHMTFFQF